MVPTHIQVLDAHKAMANTQDALQLQYLTTSDHHQIAYALIGNPALTPFLYLHGGPGSSANPGDAKLFNLDRHCVVMFDQRGCGRSTPTADISNNTTQHLINDIEQLRRELGIQQWKVYGGSWGAALALEYAKQQTERVLSIILRGSFPARKQDLDWFIQPDGIARQHPKAYEKLCQQLKPEGNELLTSCLYRILKTATDKHLASSLDKGRPGGVAFKFLRHLPFTKRSPLRQKQVITGGSPPLQKSEQGGVNAYNAALAWDHWEATVMGVPAASPETDPEQQRKRINSKLVYAHYCHHQFFLGDAGVMPGLDKLVGVPVTLIHGRQDQVCPLIAAQALAAAIPGAELIRVDAGHGLQESAIREALRTIVSR